MPNYLLRKVNLTRAGNPVIPVQIRMALNERSVTGNQSVGKLTSIYFLSN